MNSDRNLMQFDFNHFAILNFNRLAFRLTRFCGLCLILIMGLMSTVAHGQIQLERQRNYYSYRGFTPAKPRDFGDTPSPTEMLFRLKFHKQQETPLFDLLRGAGVDIFSKLSDDEKKLAGRFVEDMILKEGMDSERVSSLMEHMNIGPAARRELQKGIERAGGGKLASSPEARKVLADNVGKHFLQQFDSDLSDFNSSSSKPNLQQPDKASSFGARDFEMDQQNLTAEKDTADDAEKVVSEDLKNQQLQKQITEILKAEALKRKSDQQPNETAPGDKDDRLRQEANQSSQPNRSAVSELAGPRTKPDTHQHKLVSPPSNTASNSQNNPGLNRSQPQPSPNTAELAKADLQNSKLAQEALRQLELQADESQQKVISEVKNKLRNGDLTPQEIEEILTGLQSARTSDQLVEQLNEASKSLDLSDDSRATILESLGQHSNNERSSNQTDKSKIDQLGRDLFQDALKTYNDPDSGYELSGAFKRLKDQAEGVRSDRQFANLGKISKTLFENSSKIFDANSFSESSGASGVKPGQRLDQLLVAAASDAIANSSDTNAKEDTSAFSSIIKEGIGAALKHAVADEGEIRHDFSDNNSRFQRNSNAFGSQDPLSSLQNFTSSDTNGSASGPGSNQSIIGTNSNFQKSIASIADSMMQTKFNWQTLFFAVGLIGLIGTTIFLLCRYLSPTSGSVLKRAELQRKLKRSSSNPSDVVEAVDLFLLSRFGNDSSWWNAKHAAEQITEVKPDWRDKIASLFQVYQWSRYQPDNGDSVSADQSKLVVTTLQQLIETPIETFNSGKPSTTATLNSGKPSTTATQASDDDEANA